MESPRDIVSVTAQSSTSTLHSAHAPTPPTGNNQDPEDVFMITLPCVIPMGVIIAYRSPRFLIQALWHAIVVLGFTSLYGLIIMVIGNAILRAAGRDGFVSDIAAVRIGAVGGVFANLILLIPSAEFNVFYYIQLLFIYDGHESLKPKFPFKVWDTIITLVGSPLSGIIGVAFLQRVQVDTGGCELSHAALAGLVGGAILAVPAGFVFWEVLCFISRTIGNGPGEMLDAIRHKRRNGLYANGTV